MPSPGAATATMPPGVAELHAARATRFREQSAQQASRALALSTARLVVFVAVAAALIGAYDLQGGARLALLAAALLLLIAFGVLVWLHGRAIRDRDWQAELARGSELALARLRRDWGALPPPDPREAPADHPYAADLDVFGRASLAQLLGSVSTAPGRQRLHRWLLSPSPAAEVLERQAAVTELAPALDLRDQLAARGRLIGRVDPSRIKALLEWAEGDRWLHSHRWALFVARVLPLATLTLAGLQLAGVLNEGWWGLGVAAAAVVTFSTSRVAHRIFQRAETGEEGVAGYAEQLTLLETCDFRAPCLARLLEELRAGGGAARGLRRLDGLLSYAEARNNTLFWLPVQLLFLWDLHVLHGLERWQDTYGAHVRGWFEALGQADAIAALAALAHDHPRWSFPEIRPPDAQPVLFRAEALGHPLLAPAVCVPNDVTVGPPGTALLVTGSNMSGKSTLLRAIGLNAVLARAGGPACARALALPACELWTSMRVTDSLERGVSHFMAELERLKHIVDAALEVERRGALLYLIDEVLQGTNSAERQIAARRIIRHLVDHGAIGAVTTHDLELGDAPELQGVLVPVHFRETVHADGSGPPLTFDYLLRPGVATSRNALRLMEIVGLGGV